MIPESYCNYNCTFFSSILIIGLVIEEHLHDTSCLFQQIQTNQLPANVTNGASILNFSVTTPAVPDPPTQPSVPQEYQNVGLYGFTLVTVTQSISTISTQPGQTVDYTIPSMLVVAHEPSAKVRLGSGGSREGRSPFHFAALENIFVHVWVCVCVDAFVCVHLCVCTCMYVWCLYVWTRICACVCMRVSMCACVCVYVCVLCVKTISTHFNAALYMIHYTLLLLHRPATLCMLCWF